MELICVELRLLSRSCAPAKYSTSSVSFTESISILLAVTDGLWLVFFFFVGIYKSTFESIS